MSTLAGILGKQGKRKVDAGNNDDLERGREPDFMPPHTPPRTSYSDSEFSQHQYAVSPERYQEALQVIEGSSPQTPARIEDVYAEVGKDVQDGNQQHVALDPGSSQTSSSLNAIQIDGSVPSTRGRAPILQNSSTSRFRSPTPPLLYGRQQPTTFTNTAQDSGSGEECDWETEAKTGSSLANNSDAGNSSVEPTVPGLEISSPPARVMPYGSTPRYNQAYMLLQNAVTGDNSRIPQNNVSTGPIPRFERALNYQHPTPLFSNHPNPFTTPPPVLRTVTNPQGEDPSKLSAMRVKDSPERVSKHSILTDSFNEIVEIHGSSSKLNKQTTESSAWGTTTSESDSKDTETVLPSAMRKGSFARIAVVGQKANLTGTPEGTGAREVGSSLAGTSSPPTLTGSLSDTPNFRHRNLKAFTTPEASPTNSSQLQSGGSRNFSRIRRRRRSSSESGCLIISSPLKTKSSALPSLDFRGHRKRNTMTELAPSGNSSFYEDEDYQYESSLRERRTHQTVPDPDAINLVPMPAGSQAHTEHIQSSQTSTSAESRAFLDDQGVVHTNVPRPMYIHPVYGLKCPWDNPTENRGRPQNRPDQYLRPIARVESPHLHRIPRRPTAAMVKRQENLSNLWLFIFCFMPPVAPLFGHGALDGIICYQTQGEIQTFTDTSKNAALWWGYGTMSFIFLALIIAAALGTFS